MPHNDFTEWLQGELDQRGWDKSELARRTGITLGHVYRVMTGERRPGPEMCRSIARALTLPPEEVYRRAGLLPKVRDDIEGMQDMVMYYRQLPADDRHRLLVFARALYEDLAHGDNAGERPT